MITWKTCLLQFSDHNEMLNKVFWWKQKDEEISESDVLELIYLISTIFLDSNTFTSTEDDKIQVDQF